MLTRKLCFALNGLLSRLSSSNVMPPLPESQERVVVADGGRTIVCWHPEEPFPYEFTQPLPVNAPVEDVSFLKDLKLNYKEMSPEELRYKFSKMTYTTKHAWFPKARVRRYISRVKPDREYL